MSEQREKPRNTYEQLIVWCIAAPILGIWSLISLLPVVSVIRAWGEVSQMLIAFGFLATGALGLIALTIIYRLARWGQKRSVASASTRTLRAAALSAYAVVWMALYAL